MVSERDREHFRRLAAAEAEFNQESMRECAARGPGENIALGFALSAFAAAFAGDQSRPEEIAPAALWRQRHGRTASKL
jgi:hypothetical protein